MALSQQNNSMVISNNTTQSSNTIAIPNRSNNNKLKNAQWKKDSSKVFEYNQNQQTKWTELIQCTKCNKTTQLKWYNEHFITEHNNGNEIKYGTKMSYNVATDDGWKEHKYCQPKTTKAGSNNRKNCTKTKTIFDIWGKSQSNNISNNDNNGSGNENSVDLHPDDRNDDEEKTIVENSTQTSTNSNVYSSLNRHPNISNVNELYERYATFGLRFTCIDNDIYSFECVVCCSCLMDGKAYDISDDWEFTKAKVGIWNHFINPKRNGEHIRKENNSAWIDECDRGLKIYELHFSMLQEQIKHNLGDKSWPDRMLRRHKEGADVGNKGHSTNWAGLRKKILWETVMYTRSAICLLTNHIV